MKTLFLKVLKRSSALAMATAVVAANTTSWWMSYQPVMEDDIKKLKKL